MGDLSTTGNASRAVVKPGRATNTGSPRSRCSVGRDHRLPPNPAGGYCGEWFDAWGDGSGCWQWPDGLSTAAVYCKRCSRAVAERADAREHLAALREWATTLPATERVAVEEYADFAAGTSPVRLFPAPGHAAFRAWRDLRAPTPARSPSQTPPPRDDAQVAPQPSALQNASDRVSRRRRSDVR